VIGGLINGTASVIESALDNSGTIVADGQVDIYTPITGSGAMDIGPNGFLEVANENASIESYVDGSRRQGF
jgi:hypothetical protein